MAESQPANLLELFPYVSSTFLYLLGPVMKALDPISFALMCSRTKFFVKNQVLDMLTTMQSCRPQSLRFDVESGSLVKNRQFLHPDLVFVEKVLYDNVGQICISL